MHAAMLLSLLYPPITGYSVAYGPGAHSVPPIAPQRRPAPARVAALRMEVEAAAPSAVQLAVSSTFQLPGGSAGSGIGSSSSDGGVGEEDWSFWLSRPRYARLRDIALSITVRRTVNEAELALKLAREYSSNPSLLQDIDFSSLILRLQRDIDVNNAPLSASGMLSAAELDEILKRQIDAIAELKANPLALELALDGAVSGAAGKLPKLRRVISRARELPLTIDLPAIQGDGGLDFRLALNENVVEAVQQAWQRLSGTSPEKEETLMTLHKESRALLSLRAEATKLRGGDGV
jgi:hypothetical protein